MDPEALVKMPLHERIKYLQTYDQSSSEDGEPQSKGLAPAGPSKSRSSGSAPQEQPQDGKASSGGDASKAAAQPRFNFTSTQEELSDGLAMAGDASKASHFKPPSFNQAKPASKYNSVNSEFARGPASEGVDSSREGEVVAQHAVFGKVFTKKRTISR